MSDSPASTPPPETALPPRRATMASIIIPVHNKATLTRQCLNALLAERDLMTGREIIVVDDGSSDLTPELLAAYGEQIRVVRNDRAVGFAGACNAGASASQGEYIIFLNNDTIPVQGWFNTLVAYADAHPQAAIVGTKLLFPNNTIQHAGVVFGVDRYPHHIYAGFPADHPATCVSRRYQAVTAACLLVDRAAWNEMGGFDRTFINGWEDVDLCLRLGEAGYEIHYCADSVIYHMESASRDLRAPQERENRGVYEERWRPRVRPDDFDYYTEDGLITFVYPARYPMQISFSPLLAGVVADEGDRLADRLLHERARQTSILMRNNIVLNVRVEEAELKARMLAERAEALEREVVRLGGIVPERTVDLASPATPPAADAESAETPANPPAPTAQQQPILGRVESPSREPGVVTDQMLPILGWAMSQVGIASVETFIDDQASGIISFGEPRPDVAALYPGFPDAENCGFTGGIPMHDFEDGPHQLEIRITANDGKVARITANFELDSTAFSTGRVLMRMDRPAPNTRLRARDRLFLAGWAISPFGMDRIEAYLDGELQQALAYGALRPDVSRSYPFYPNVDHSGFSSILNINHLADGEHELRVRAVAQDGQEAELVIPFLIDASAPAHGEVPALTEQYGAWLDKNAKTSTQMTELAARVLTATDLPSFDVIVPLTNDSLTDVQDFVASLRSQLYPNWRLLLPVSTSARDDVHTWVKDHIRQDPRIGYAPVESGEDPVALVNAALGAVKGDWVAMFDTSVRLQPDALADIALDIREHPEAMLLYTDQDRVDTQIGMRWDPFFKPDWSPDLLLSMNYVGEAVFYRADLMRDLGALTGSTLDGAEYDLLLRATEQAAEIRHLPRPLVSIAAKLGEIPVPSVLAREESRVAIASALARRGIAGHVESGNTDEAWRVRYAIEGEPGVSIVMPTGGKMQFLVPCMTDLLEKTTHKNLQIVVLDNSGGTEVAEYLATLQEEHPEIVRVPIDLQPFNFSALVNAAIPHITEPYTLMLNDDITVISPDWIEAMLEHAQRPEIGVVGAKLLFPDGTIQHCGVILGPYEGTGHAFKFYPGDDSRYFGLPNVIRNYLGVTFACAMMRTSVLKQIGGLDAENLPIAFNDVDFCLKAVELGLRNVYTPHAVLTHHESVTKKVIAKPTEIGHLRQRWAAYIKHDPYYNPNLTRRAEDATLRMD